VRDLLRQTGFRRLLAGQTISAVGDWMATVALMALVLDITDSSAAVGGILVLRLAPSMVAGPLTTRAVQRWDRKQTMLAMDALRAVMVVLIPLVDALWWVYLWAFLLECCGLVFLPARDAAIPDLVERESELPLANGLVLASSYGTIPVGAGLFGLASLLAGDSGRVSLLAVFAVDAATFVASFWFVRRIEGLTTGASGLRPGERRGLLAAFRIPMVRRMMGPTVTVSLGIGTLFSIGIVFVRQVLRASNTEFGVLIALFGLGAGVGLGVLHRLAPPPLVAVQVAVTLQGAVIAVMSQAGSVTLAFVGAAAFGATTAATLSSAMSALQAMLADDDRVIAFAAFHVVIRAALSAAALGAGFAADLVGAVRWPVVGRLEPARAVLLSAGLAVALAGLAVGGEPGHRFSALGRRPHPLPNSRQ
jgi:predicted MFS family arabinose efflux permease